MKIFRISFDFSEEAYKELNKIVEKTNATSKGEVVQKALGLYITWLNQIEDGWEVHYKNGKCDQKVEISFE